MNISLENALLEDIDQVRFKYENLYIKGRHIRYIHIPKEVRHHYLIGLSAVGLLNCGIDSSS